MFCAHCHAMKKHSSTFPLVGNSSDFNPDWDSTVYMCFSHICFPVRKKSGRSSLALAVWNSSLSLNLHSSSSSSLPTVCLKELRSALMTHSVAPTARHTEGRGIETLAHLAIQNEIWDFIYSLLCTVPLLKKTNCKCTICNTYSGIFFTLSVFGLPLYLWGRWTSWGTQESQRSQQNRGEGHWTAALWCWCWQSEV